MLLVSFDETFMNNLLVVLFFLYILNHVQVSEMCVFLSCAGCYSTGAASGQYQLREEDISSSTGVSSSRDSCRRRRAAAGGTVLPTTETPMRGGKYRERIEIVLKAF